MAEPYREVRDDGTYEYNAVTDKWYNVGDYSTRMRSTEFRQSDYEKLKETIKSYAGRDGISRGESQSLFVRIANANLSYDERLKLQNLVSSQMSKHEQNLERSHSTVNKENKSGAIQAYKAAWRNKNPLWKLFHQKYNPKNRNFDAMSEFSIENSTRRMK